MHLEGWRDRLLLGARTLSVGFLHLCRDFIFFLLCKYTIFLPLLKLGVGVLLLQFDELLFCLCPEHELRR